MKEVRKAADTLHGVHVTCNFPLEIGEKVLYEGQFATVTEILSVGKAYMALGQGETYEEMSANATLIQPCWARIDNQRLPKRELVFLRGSGLPVDLPGEDD